jgi:hypothetical protein
VRPWPRKNGPGVGKKMWTDGPEGAGRGAAHPARRRAWTCGGGARALPPPPWPLARPRCLWWAEALVPAGAPRPWWRTGVRRRDRCFRCALAKCQVPLSQQASPALHCRAGAPQRHVGRGGVRFWLVVSARPKETPKAKRLLFQGEVSGVSLCKILANRRRCSTAA